jgi:hypothetical protein
LNNIIEVSVGRIESVHPQPGSKYQNAFTEQFTDVGGCLAHILRVPHFHLCKVKMEIQL